MRHTRYTRLDQHHSIEKIARDVVDRPSEDSPMGNRGQPFDAAQLATH